MYDLDWVTVEIERRILFWMSCGMIMSALVVFGVLLMMPAPYGRYASTSWGWLMDARYAWFIQESPSLVVPCVLWLCHNTTLALPNKLLLGVFVIHYIHRYIQSRCEDLRSCSLTPSTPTMPATPASHMEGAADGSSVT